MARPVWLLLWKGYVDGETCVAALVASQMPQDYEMEALKAQAIIARTYLHGKAEEAEGELLEEEALRALLNETGSIKRAREAAAETAGQVLTYDGELIRPLYHAVSAGMTRQGEFPYLKAADSSRDMEAEGYLTVLDWTPGEFAAAFRAGMKALGQEVLLTEAEIPDSIQMVEQDSGGYVRQIQIGSHVYDGESVQMALGLPSCAYTLEQVEGKVRALCRGKGEEKKQENVQIAGNANAQEHTEEKETKEPEAKEDAKLLEGEPQSEVDAALVGAGQNAAVPLALNFTDQSRLGWPVYGNILLDYSVDSTIYFPTLAQYQTNPGLVIQAEVSQSVVAPANARVAAVGVNEELGNYVVLDLGNDYLATCGQLKEVQVTENEYLEAGQLLGYVAEPTKYYSVEGSNVFFELRRGGDPLDPLDYLE